VMDGFEVIACVVLECLARDCDVFHHFLNNISIKEQKQRDAVHAISISSTVLTVVQPGNHEAIDLTFYCIGGLFPLVDFDDDGASIYPA
jgi:hypothetical protein